MTDRSAFLAPIEDSIFENSRTKIDINTTSFNNSFDNHIIDDLKFKKSPSKAPRSKHTRKASNISAANSKNKKSGNSKISKKKGKINKSEISVFKFNENPSLDRCSPISNANESKLKGYREEDDEERKEILNAIRREKDIQQINVQGLEAIDPDLASVI